MFHELPGLTMNVYGRLPTCILPSYWSRHSLSRKDIDTIISYVPTSLLWKCAILYGITPPWYSLRSSSSSSMTVSLSGKAIAVDMLLHHTKIFPPTNESILDVDSVESLEHVPPIPRYYVTRDIYHSLHNNICSQLVPEKLLLSGDTIGTISFLYTFLDRQWVPVSIEGASICCNAVIKKSEYKTYENFTCGYTHLSKIGKFENDLYLLTDELILIGRSE